MRECDVFMLLLLFLLLLLLKVEEEEEEEEEMRLARGTSLLDFGRKRDGDIPTR